MPIPTNNSRPSLPYTPDQSLPNNQRFTLLDKRPPTAPMLDAEFNSLQDDVNRLAQGINEVEAGSIPGADDPLNAHKVLKTDGQGTLSFTLINSHQVARHAVVEGALAPQSVTTPKIGDGAVTSRKLAERVVQTRHLQDAAVETQTINEGAVTTAKIADQAIETAQIGFQAVTTDKMADGGVTTVKLTPSAVTTTKIANAAITTPKIGLGAVTTEGIATHAVTHPKVALKGIRVSNIDAQTALRGEVLMAQDSGDALFRKIASTSFDPALIHYGSVLGSLDGMTLAPVGGLIFCMFWVVPPNTTLNWKGFNVQTARNEGNRVTVTYKRRTETPKNLFGFATNNVSSVVSVNETGFTYLASGYNSFIVWALLPEGN